MSKESLEHLSSLMDGEINKDTGRFLIRRLGADSEMRATWARYHLVRDCLRHQEASVPGTDFSSRVQQALAEEETSAVRPAFGARWLKPVAGIAIAASVALMAIVTVGPGQNSVDSPVVETFTGAQTASFVSPNSALSLPPISQQASTAGESNDRERMNSYLLRHYQVAGGTGGKGFVTLVPIVVTRTTSQEREELQDQAEEDSMSNSLDTARQ